MGAVLEPLHALLHTGRPDARAAWRGVLCRVIGIRGQCFSAPYWRMK